MQLLNLTIDSNCFNFYIKLDERRQIFEALIHREAKRSSESSRKEEDNSKSQFRIRARIAK